LKATVINFLGISNSNQTTIVFGSLKRIEILDIPDVINFAVSQANQILPRFRLPYCSYDS